ncbi:MAG TPA: carboxypeptidase regulatory-like domain-containing protein, partial [Gemmatimonadales bacterium]|nr:carboxypeptidase regulatory-like domain-containing protein [Gemmatimonadales bacterium]
TRTDGTDANGSYVLPNLPPGPYRLEVSLAGFRSYAQTGIVLQVAGTPEINIVLMVGALEETVTVEGASPLVDVQSSGVSEVVRTQEILELPLNGRNAADLVAIVGAAVRTGEANSRSMQGGVAYSVAGGQTFGVAFLLDGAMHNDPQNNLNLPLPFPDALQEFRVATSGLTAENGMHSGASVNAVTKSGTNRFSGNVFEFLRDHRFNAINPLALKKPNGELQDDGLRRNQFGGTLGGPLVRNKLFFFGAYQGTLVRQTPAANIAWVPSAAMLSGDFTAFASPACNGGRQITLRGGFENNRIDPARFSRAALNLVKRLPATTDPCGQIQYTTTEDSTEGQFVGRIDYQWTTNHSLFGRYMATSVKNPTPLTRSDSVLSLYNTVRGAGIPGLDKLAQSLAVGDTRVYGPNTVNSLRFAFNRTSVDRLDTPLFDPYAIGSNVYSYDPGAMVLAVTGGFNIANPGGGLFNTNSSQLSDDLTLVRGSHELSVGANLAYWKHYFFSHARSGGDWLFNGQLTGLGLSDFLMGRVGRLEHGGPAVMPMDQWYLGLYAQDAWRVTPHVTINAGLRWEPYFGANVLNDAVYNFSRDNFRSGIKTTVFKNAPAGLIYPGDRGFPPGRTGLETQWWNLSPRVGVAWDVTGNGRTAIRSAYGISYDFPTAEYQLINANSPPFGNRSLVEDPPGGFDNPYAHLGGDPHPILTSPDTQFIPFGAFGATAPDINSPRIQQWNATFEKQIGRVWQVSASYLGSYTDRLWGQVAINPGVFQGLGPCTLGGVFYATCSTNANLNQRRVFSLSEENPAAAQLIGNMDIHTDIGTQSYRGLKLAFQRRPASGVSLIGNYTLSRCFGDATTPGGGFPQIANGFTKPDDPAFDRGHCIQDRTHIGSFTAGVQTPQFASRALRAVASNWRVSGIVSALSGSWLNIITGRDNALTGIQQQRVDQVSDNVYGEKTLTSYLNPAAFAQPAPGALGNYERNSIKGPGYWTVDVALSKQIAVGGARGIELRVESFNLLNTFNWGNPVTNFNSGSFGRITSMTGAPRIMQFGVKYG